MPRSVHVGLSVRGALRWGKREFRDALKWMRKDGGTPFGNVEELREALMDELAQGHEVIPCGPCDNWDWKTGCKGHATPAAEGASA